MPHLTLEYTDNIARLDPAALLAAVNYAALKSGLFDEADVKSRAYAAPHFRIGLEEKARAFIHVRIGLLSGRSSEERRMLSDLVLMALNAAVDAPPGTELQLSVETVELDRPSYAKVVRHG